jgi:hypothetical protein
MGTKNKFTTLKAAFLKAFEEIGGTETLVEWARLNKKDFYTFVTKMLPREVEVSGIPGPGGNVEEALRNMSKAELESLVISLQRASDSPPETSKS